MRVILGRCLNLRVFYLRQRLPLLTLLRLLDLPISCHTQRTMHLKAQQNKLYDRSSYVSNELALHEISAVYAGVLARASRLIVFADGLARDSSVSEEEWMSDPAVR